MVNSGPDQLGRWERLFGTLFLAAITQQLLMLKVWLFTTQQLLHIFIVADV